MEESDDLPRPLCVRGNRPCRYPAKQGKEFASLHVPFPFVRDRLSLQILALGSRKVMNFGPRERDRSAPAILGGAAGSKIESCDQRGTTAVASISTFAASSTRRTTWINAMAG